jgi:hypothetical protein
MEALSVKPLFNRASGMLSKTVESNDRPTLGRSLL